MSLLRHRDLFHTGIVAVDFDAARAELPDALGIRWGPGGDADVPVVTADGVCRVVHFRYAYRVEGPVHIELVAAVDDSPWAIGDGETGWVHHLAYWSDDVARDSARLAAAGVPLVASVGVEQLSDPPRIAYHERHGCYLELVPVAMRPLLFGAP